MKKLYIIGGTMGVGKTTISEKLNNELNNSVFLDGDWCWKANPFVVNEETKKMVVENICFVLNNFLQTTSYKNIIFCWVLNEQRIIDDIISRLDTLDCEIKCISLMASIETLKKRLNKDIDNSLRSNDIIERSIKRLKMYDNLSTIKINTDNKSVDDIVLEIMKL